MTTDNRDAESTEKVTHCPECGARPVVTWATGWRVCGTCELRWNEDTGETLERVIKEEYEQLFGANRSLTDRLRGLLK